MRKPFARKTKKFFKRNSVTVKKTSSPLKIAPRFKIDSSCLKIGQAAKVLGVSIDTLRRWEKAGKIKAIRTPGGTRLYSFQALKKVNPDSVADFQAKSLTTEELLKKVQEDKALRYYDIPDIEPFNISSQKSSKFLPPFLKEV